MCVNVCVHVCVCVCVCLCLYVRMCVYVGGGRDEHVHTDQKETTNTAF